ncbi:alpha/beta fold hydrolase [Corynebacterium pilosum]|uniref:Proline iminopeptidase n=1 Tax=Corynebacterium pilosum TaxID=35756 RepID=A0A376CK07_9CORY|nr:alpha/beta fold hydrolase [Corynebacterium pilosum]STC68602.1 proline iminopeptidase [Corynebacterium pilosum]
MRTVSATYGGLTIHDHTLPVPWDRTDPTRGNCQLFARELVADPAAPTLLYLQGGPGNPAPRPTDIDGWLATALRHYRVVLLDQRGTGRSSRVDRHSLNDDSLLPLLRADNIVADAEELRQALGLERWDVLGQSFGGFCITHYLSVAPESVGRAYFTGGLPGVGVHADDVYRATFATMELRHREFYDQVPWAEERVREVCHHLDNADETLPTGERLSSRRLRTVGIGLGRGNGIADMAMLFDAPFYTVRGEKRLQPDFLAEVGQRVSFERTPLYALIHESIYGAPGAATAWSAQRVSEQLEGFAPDADPTGEDPFYLTGEHIFPFLFDEDPALQPLREAAHRLAVKDDWSALYDPSALAEAESSCAAAVYTNDMFVPRAMSLNTAALLPHMTVWETAKYQHDGIRRAGDTIADTLFHLARRL